MYGHVIAKFSRMGRLLHFLTHGAPLARFARESSAIKEWQDFTAPSRNEDVARLRCGLRLRVKVRLVSLELEIAKALPF